MIRSRKQDSESFPLRFPISNSLALRGVAAAVYLNIVQGNVKEN